MEKSSPEEIFVCYPVWAGLPIRYHYPAKSKISYAYRLTKNKGKLAVVETPDMLSGSDFLTGKSFKVQIRQEGRQSKNSSNGPSFMYYSLAPIHTIEGAEDGHIWIAMIQPVRSEMHKKIRSILLKDNRIRSWFLVNPFLQSPVVQKETGETVIGSLFASEDPQMSINEALKLEEEFNGVLQFFVLQ